MEHSGLTERNDQGYNGRKSLSLARVTLPQQICGRGEELRPESLMPPLPPPASETSIKNGVEAAVDGRIVPKLVPHRENIWHEIVLQDGMKRHHARDGCIESCQGHELPDPEDQDRGQPCEVRGRVVCLVGADNKVRVHSHSDGEEIDEHIHEEDVRETCAQKRPLVSPALIASRGLDWPRARVDRGFVIYMRRRFGLRD